MHRATVVASLGVGQLLAWGSTFYLPAVLAEPMADTLGVTPSTVFLAFSVAMGGSALVGPAAGRAIDRFGGRPVLLATNLLFAAGLAALASTQGTFGLFAAWILIGLAMGAGLYEAAFATVVRLYGTSAKDAITGITLFGGFASTVGWPLSAWMETRWGWRGACVGWALLHVGLALPLHALLPRAAPASDRGSSRPEAAPPASPPAEASEQAATDAPPTRWAMALLAFLFASTWFVTTAFAAHGPRLLEAAGATAAAAVAVGAMVGPAQVAGRLLQFGPLRHADPMRVAGAATLGHPVAVVVLLFAGPAFAPLFALLHGAGGGLMTIARGALPLALFGPVGYGERQGLLMAPTRVAQAVSPYLFGLALDRWGAQALWGSAALCVAGWLALRALAAGPRRGR